LHIYNLVPEITQVDRETTCLVGQPVLRGRVLRIRLFWKTTCLRRVVFTDHPSCATHNCVTLVGTRWRNRQNPVNVLRFNWKCLRKIFCAFSEQLFTTGFNASNCYDSLTLQSLRQSRRTAGGI